MAKSVIISRRRTSCWGDPPIFRNDEDALHWAIGQGVYPDLTAARAAYEALQAKYPQYTVGIWALWIGHVAQQITSKERARWPSKR